MVKWSKIFDHDHGQNFKISVVKWSKLAIFDHDHGQNFKIAVVKWSKLVILTIDHGQNRGLSWSWSTFLTIDHGVNSRVSWSWSVPYPPPLIIDIKVKFNLNFRFISDNVKMLSI